MNATLIIGSPGSGKTHRLTELVSHYTNLGYKPSEITVLSHTRVAAKEIAERAGGAAACSTLHAFAYRMAEVAKEQVISTKHIREFSEGIGVPMKGAVGTDNRLENGDEYIGVINYATAHGKPYNWAYKIKGLPGSHDEFEFFCANYDAWKKSFGYIDFNDMLELAINSGNDQHLPVLLVDEIQDTSMMQWKLLNIISKNTKEMTVVGDPNQSLFSWGGAYPKGMIDWAEDTGAKREYLTQSYRVPKAAHTLSMAILNRVKEVYGDGYEPTDVDGDINRYLTPAHYDIKGLDKALILYRNHALRGEIENELILSRKPYTTLNGPKGLCQNKYAVGLEAWLRVTKHGMLSSTDISKIKVIAAPKYLRSITNNDMDAIVGTPGIQALNIPDHYLDYYRDVDLSKKGDILLSTIHGAKGKQHHKVILINAVTQRVMDEFMCNPDPEFLVWFVAVTRTSDILDIIDGNGDSIL